MMKFQFIRRVAQIALARKHEFIVAVLTFAPDHRLFVGLAFAGVLAIWFVGSALIESWRRAARAARRWLMNQATFTNGRTLPSGGLILLSR